MYVEPARNATTSILPTALLNQAFENKIAYDRMFLLTHSPQRAHWWLRVYVKEAERRQFSPGISLNADEELAQGLTANAQNKKEVLAAVQKELFPVRQFALREHLDVVVQVEIWRKDHNLGYTKSFERSLNLSKSYPIIDTSTPRSHQFLRYEEISERSFEELAQRLATQALEDFYSTQNPVTFSEP